ncbi:hypothetical protein ACTJJB_22540 [Chitinophaga sp. 22536]|uniref:hypothetical protein n=1 Tax=unclassified Chitinophaga TaxID=2619133 RepID=UPI003F84C786
MNLNFKLRLDELNENDPTSKNSSSVLQTEFYEHSGHIREVCFVPLHGKIVSLNYAYWVAREFEIEENRMTLLWTTHIVVLKGIRLMPLFFDFFYQLPKIVVAQDARYNATAAKDTPIVNDIKVQENG